MIFICAVNFQNGCLQDEDVDSALYEDSQHKRFVGVASDLIYGGKIQRDELYENFLVVVNKKTNKVRLSYVYM